MGSSHRAFGMQQVIRAARHRHRTGKLAAGLGFHRGDRYGAADGVAAEQRALRPAQHFQPLDIHDVENGAHRAGDVDAVHVETHARLGGGQKLFLTHAAQIDGGGVRRAAKAGVVLQGHAGHELGDLVEAGNAAVVQGFAGIGGNGDGRALQPFLPHAGRHHDLFQHQRRAVPSLRGFGRASVERYERER